jgi:hypothetical protein
VVAIPAVCLAGGELKVVDGSCDVVDAAALGWELSDARSTREAMRILAKTAAGKIVILSFPREMALDRKVELVQKMLEAERRLVNGMINRIQGEMNEDPIKARWLRENAEIDSSNVADMKKRVAREFSSVADAAERHFTEHPRSAGVQGKCLTACRQVVAGARGINVFDSR